MEEVSAMEIFEKIGGDENPAQTTVCESLLNTCHFRLAYDFEQIVW